MALQRVLAHFMHEYEREAARTACTNSVTTDSFVLGTIDDADIPQLEAQGLIVQVLEEPRRIETAATATRAAQSASHLGPPPLPTPPPPRPGQRTYFLVQLAGPLLEEWRLRLADAGAELLERVPEYAYTVRMSPEQAVQVRALDFATEVRLYAGEDTGPAVYGAAAEAFETPDPARGVQMVTWDVLLHREADRQQVLDWLGAQGISIAGSAGRKIRIYLPQGSNLVADAAIHPAVARLDPHVPPRLHNDVARGLLGVGTGNPTGGVALTGKGQVVGVADTGLDDQHPDFSGRIKGIVALGRPGNHSDPHGHGTHVAGSVLGDGTASGRQFAGVAPGAELYFQSLLDAHGGLGGIPVALEDLFEQAYSQGGVRIHNNSWGAATSSAYTINSTEVDAYVAKRRDLLIVISAGNDGTAASALNSAPGFVDWLSIGSPASCKNALTVGAARTSRTSGGLAAQTWGQTWAADYPLPPIRDECVSGDPQAMAAFSSRGPCDDGRIKPDVVAPGTDILSARSQLAPLHNFWGLHDNNRYAYMGGTSMAAPLVAGCAALCREYFCSRRNHAPSAALLKATLINGARWLSGADAVADCATCPNYHQGFGAVYLPDCLPDSANPKLRLEFVDPWQQPNEQFTHTGQRRRFQLSVGVGTPLRFCLAYSDAPGRALQNNLNLFVQHMDSGTKWWGNSQRPRSLRIPDPDNNVEVVRLEDPLPGDYLVQVAATNLLHAPQDFAVVVTGNLTTGLVETF